MKNRERSTNLTNSESTQDTDAQQSTQMSGNEQSDERSTQIDHVGDESTSSVILQESENSLLAQATRKRKYDEDIVDIIRELENNHTKRQDERDIRRKQEKQHPIEIFFQSMAQTSKEMPTFMQNRIKRKVLEIVCEAEEELESYNIHNS